MVGFEEIFATAYHLKRIEDIIFQLRTDFNGVLLVALMYDKKGRNPKNVFFKRTKEIVDKLNKEISLFNKNHKKYLKQLRANNLENIDIKKIKKIISEHKAEESLGRKHTHLKLNSTIIPLKISIRNFFNSFDNIFIPFGGRDRKYSLRKKIKRNLIEALDIYSIGYYTTAVFIVGRTLERAIRDYIKKLKSNKKINYQIKEINKWTFHDCIKILKKEKFLTISQYSKIMSVKWDRNTFGHPATLRDTNLAKKDCDAIITIGINSIQYIEKQIDKL